MLPSDSLPPSTLPSLLTRLYGATELHNDSMGANEDYESAMRLVNIRSHAQMIYSISVTAYMPSIPVVCLCLQPLEDSVFFFFFFFFWNSEFIVHSFRYNTSRC